MNIIVINDNKKDFLNLLLLADEQEDMIEKYLERGALFALYDNDLKSVCVVTNEGNGIFEIQNIATYPQFQGKGYGKYLINYVCDYYRDKGTIILVGTGDTPVIVSFYENIGFKISHRIENFFIENYRDPIIEHGIQLKDKVFLKRDLRTENTVLSNNRFPNKKHLNGDIIVVRKMFERDIDNILNNYHEQGWEKPREVIEDYFIRQNNSEIFMFIAEYRNDAAGYTVLYPNARYGPFKDKNIPEISDFVVFTKYQRKGIGNLILDAAEQKALELSSKISLGVGLHCGYGSAQRIYAKRGYIPDGTGIWYNGSQLEPYADCKNNDELTLFLVKEQHAG